MADKATISHRRQGFRLSGAAGHGRPRRRRHPQALRPDRRLHLRSRLHLDRELRVGDHLYRRRRGHPAPPRLSDRPARRAIDLHGGLATCCSTASCRARTSSTSSPTRSRRHTMLHEQLATFYRGFRRDAHPMAIMCGVVGALSAFYHDSTDITDPEQRMIASAPADRQDADDRGDGLQIFDRPAVHLSAERPSATPATSCA